MAAPETLIKALQRESITCPRTACRGHVECTDVSSPQDRVKTYQLRCDAGGWENGVRGSDKSAVPWDKAIPAPSGLPAPLLACLPPPSVIPATPPLSCPPLSPLSCPPLPLCHSHHSPSVIPATPPLSFPTSFIGNPSSSLPRRVDGQTPHPTP